MTTRDYRHDNHCVYLCDYHIVLPTKYRHAVITPILKKYYWGTDSLWSEGYFVSTLGVTTDTIKRYIAKQGALDTGQTASLFDLYQIPRALARGWFIFVSISELKRSTILGCFSGDFCGSRFSIFL